MSIIKKIFLSTIVLLFVLLISCEKPYKPPIPKINKLDILKPINDNLIADVFLDASLSMEGFITSGASSKYLQILQGVESAFLSGWPDCRVHFYQFGSKVLALPERGYLHASKREFYQNNEINTKTNIQKVIEYEYVNQNKLILIITDLYQDNSDVNLLSSILKEKCIKQNLAIGILGIKGQFNGNIYDVGTDNFTFNYKSAKDNYETYRPFYIILIGRHSDIARFHSQLTSAVPSIDLTNFIFFSRYLVNPFPTFSNATIDSINNLTELTQLSAIDTCDFRFRKFKLSGNQPNANFISTLKCNILPLTIPFDKNLVNTFISYKLCKNDTMIICKESENFLTVKQKFWQNNILTLRFDFKNLNYLSNGIYLFEVILRPASTSHKFPNWLDKWNMDLETIDLIKENPRLFNGGKTINLKHFINDLWQINLEYHNPKIATLYFFLKKD